MTELFSKKVLVIFPSMFQVIHVFCGSSVSKGQGITLMETFSFDVTACSQLGEVIVWKITAGQTTFKPLLPAQRLVPFQSDETFLLLAHKEARTLQFYYWIGKHASIDDKKAIAKYAMMFYTLVDEYYTTVTILSREYEGTESFSYRETLNGVMKDELVTRPELIKRLYHVYQDKQLPSQFPNLYVVRGTGDTRMKKVPINTDWLKVDDACLILETGPCEEDEVTISIYCGEKASHRVLQRSELFARSFNFYEWEVMSWNYIRFISNTPRDEIFLTQFHAILGKGNEHNAHEVDDPNDRLQGAEDFVKSRNDVYLAHYSRVLMKTEILARPVVSTTFYDVHGVYFFDTKSPAGAFLVMGKYSKRDVRIMAIEEAEKHSNEYHQRPIRMRIMKIGGNCNYLDFNIHLANWPPNPVEDIKCCGVLI